MRRHRPSPLRWYHNDALIPLAVNVAMLLVVLVVWGFYSLLILALAIVLVNIVLWTLQFVREWRELHQLWKED